MPGISDDLEPGVRLMAREASANGSRSPSRVKLAARYGLPAGFAGPYYASYVFFKLLCDPVYRAVEAELRGSHLPLLDVGCGIGLLASCLRSCGHRAPIHGVDYDARKIRMARRVMRDEPAVRFEIGDARSPLPEHSGNVTILDILQYLRPEQQTALLDAAAARVAPGGRLILRSALRAENWRFRLTQFTDRFSRLTAWMPESPVSYPTRETFTTPLAAAGLSGRIEPLSGRLPFHNFLFVFRRPSDG
jgi:SAM-dependent methyltransferase